MRFPELRRPQVSRFLKSPWVFLSALQVVQWIAVLVHAERHTNQSTAFVWLSVLVGLPIALYCVYRIASTIGGRALGALAAFVWVVVPFAMYRLFDPRYRYQYIEQIVPRALGLTESGEFWTMVALLVACLFTLWALRRGRPRAYFAGLAAGIAGMVDAVGLLFVPAALAAFLAGRRPRLLVPFALGLAPGIIVVLARGTGGDVEAGNWNDLQHNGTFIREFFYSLRVLEYLPIAGALAIGRRSIPAMLLVGGWFLAFLAVQGTSSDVTNYTFWRAMLPSLPAYVLLASAIPLLVPAPRAFREVFLRGRWRRPRSRQPRPQ
jgi:hypothetical protein